MMISFLVVIRILDHKDCAKDDLVVHVPLSVLDVVSHHKVC